MGVGGSIVSWNFRASKESISMLWSHHEPRRCAWLLLFLYELRCHICGPQIKERCTMQVWEWIHDSSHSLLSMWLIILAGTLVNPMLVTGATGLFSAFVAMLYAISRHSIQCCNKFRLHHSPYWFDQYCSSPLLYCWCAIRSKSKIFRVI